ncbi:type IV toxin-antitoxin system AbiEi family antitoxin [Cryobacterium melibiosiphilum]|nr:type IV toxin-antitoxin system AbiEi family antitoxin [Cryobacterium melibiosiphilum]
MTPPPANTRLPSILSATDLPIAALCGARLDGEVYPLGDFWCLVDENDGPITRARATSMLVSVAVAAERATAAWIYGLTPEPARHELRLDSRARKHVQPSVRVRVREVRDPFADTVDIGGVPVTTPLRTAVDLALSRGDLVDGRHELGLVALLADLLRYSGYGDTHAAIARCVPAHSPVGERAAARFAAVQQLLDRAP